MGLTRRLAVRAGAGVLVAVATLVLLHAPLVRDALQARLQRTLLARYALQLTATSVRYNLLTRRVEAEGLQLAARGHEDRPFFRAAHTEVVLSWNPVTGHVAVLSLDVTGGQVLLHTDAAGRSNLLPGSGAAPPETPRRLDVRALRVRGLDVTYRDVGDDVEVVVRGIEADWQPRRPGAWPGMAGSLALRGSTSVRFGEEQTTGGSGRGRAEFDGSTVRLRQLTVPFPEGEATVDGPITRVFDDTRLDLALRADVDLAAAAHWVAPPMAVSGRAGLTGTVTGPPGNATLTTDWTADSARIGRLERVHADLRLQVTAAALEIPQFTVRAPDGGTARGRLRSAFGDDAWLDADAAWSAVDLDDVLAIAEMDAWPAAARLDGTMTARQGPGEHGPAAVRVHTISRPLRRAGRAPAAGTLDWTYAGGHWTATHTHRLLDAVEVRGVHQGDARDMPFADGTVRGRLTIDAQDAGVAWRAARRAGLVAADATDLHGALHADLETSGVLGDPSLRGTVTGPALRYARAGFTLAADVRVTPATMALSSVDLRTAGLTLGGQVAVQRASQRIDGSMQAHIDTLGPLIDGLGLARDATGTGTMTAAFSGTTTRPAADVVVRLDAPGVAGQSASRLDASARVTRTDVRVDALVLEQGVGRFEARGHFDRARGRYEIAASGRDLRWLAPVGAGDTRPRAVVLETLRAEGRGTLVRPEGTGSASLRLEGGRAAALAGTTTLALEASAGLARLQLAAPALGLDARADLDARAPYAYRAHLEAPRVSLDTLAALAGLPERAVTGEARLSADARGALGSGTPARATPGGRAPAAPAPRAEATITLGALEGAAGGVAVRLERPVDLAWDGAGVVLGPLAASLGNGRLEAEGRAASARDGVWTAAFDGRVEDVAAMARAVAGGAPAGAEAGGLIRARVTTTGGLDAARGTFAIEEGRVQVEGLPALTGVRVEAALGDRAIDVTTIRGRWQGATLAGTARVPVDLLTSLGDVAGRAPAGRIQLAVTHLTTQALAPWLDVDQRARLSGEAAVTLEAALTTRTAAGVRGTIGIEATPWRIGGVPVEQRRPFRMSLDDGRLRFDEVHWLVGGSALDVSGTVHLTGAEAGAVDTRVAGTLDLRMLSALVPGVASDGTAQLDLRVSGTTEAPRFGGRVDLDDAELLSRDPSVVVSDLRGPVHLDGSLVRIPELTGTVNGGRLTVAGEIRLDGAVPSGGEVLAQVQGAVFEPSPGIQGEVDALLRFTPDPLAPRLAGDVLVQRSAYRANVSIPALLRRARARSRPWQVASLTDRLQLAVAVASVEDLSIDNNYGRMSAGVDLRVTGTPARPGLTGRVALREGGQAYLLGRTYRLEASSLTFLSPTAITPELDVTTLAQVRGRTVTLHLTGPLERLETSVQSSDASETPESLAAVLIGKDVRGEDALALLSAEILGSTGRALGLDTLRLEQGFSEEDVRQDPGLIAQETDPSSRLTLSKRVRANVDVIVSQNLRDSTGLSAVLSYRPLPQLELRAVSRDSGNRSYALRHEVNFGGGGTPASRMAATAPRVSAVVVEGAPASGPIPLERRLALRAGQAFSFVRWQDDVARVRQAVQAQGFLEARVRADRRPSADGTGVALAYRVLPGPRTVLEVQGLAVPGSLRAALEDAWTRSVFDPFLLDELVRLTRLHLLRQGTLGSVVTARVVDRTDDSKRILVEVAPGTTVRQRRVVFEGARALDVGALRRAIEDAGAAGTVWLDPASTASVLEPVYAAAGYLNAHVTAAEPTVNADTATLRVTVDEGLPYLIAALTTTGVEPGRDAAVLEQIAIAPGERFLPARMEAARERVVELFHRDGFHDVAVDVRTFVDRAAHAVGLTFAVTPGPRHVLAGLETSGALRTSPAVVARALQLEPGAAVDLREWARARKRLYDTNVFRQVDLAPMPAGPVRPDGTQPVTAAVRLTEWPAWTLRYGLQLNDDRPSDDPAASGRLSAFSLGGRSVQAALIGDLQTRSLFGHGVGGGVFTRLEQERRTTSTYLTLPALFGARLRTNAFAFTAQEDVPTGIGDLRLRRTGVSLEQRIRQAQLWEVVYGYRVEQSHLFQLDADPQDITIDARSVFGRFTGAAFLDRRINPFDPRGGWFAAATVERVSEFESRTDFAKVLATHYRYQPIGPVLLAGAVRAGTSLLGDALLTERFFTGGGTTIRGFAEDSLGPVDRGGLAAGGASVLVLNGEVRVPIYRWLRGVGFVDAGNVFAGRNPFRLSDLAVGLGGGLRLDSPFGLLRVDVAVPRGIGTGPRGARWYFGLGQVF